MEKKDAVKGLFEFIDNSPTCFQAIGQMKERFAKAGYLELTERQRWNLTEGGSYYVSRNDSALIAFQLPCGKAADWKGFHIVAAHSDSPCFKIKEQAQMETEKHYLKWDVEKYGGMILSTWLDRPLSVAGRVVVREKEKLVTKLVNIERNVAVIPNVAIHMNREMNKGVEYNPQTDMAPLVGEVASGQSFLSLLAEACGIEKDAILGHDMFLYNREKCTTMGMQEEYICGPRLDDLECAYAGMEALLAGNPGDYVNMLVIFDNEEVGSGTKQGADSTFLKDVLSRISCGMALEEEQYRCMLADSFLISADNAHGVHPNHPEKADPENRPYLNEGIVIKYHGSQKYATDAYSGAVMKEICRKAKVPYQTYANRSDIPGGSTLGNILMAQVSMNTVDIGLPQLAMHSAYETAGSRDIAYLIDALTLFYQAEAL